MKQDKQVYIERCWTRCQLMALHGGTVLVRLPGGDSVKVPFEHVRDVDAECRDCGRLLWGSSFQARDGNSFCSRCYEKLDDTDIELLFGGPQWYSWDGQMAVRDMDEDHLINTLGRLRRNAEEAAEHAGGLPEEYLSPHFPRLVAELRRRRPDDVGNIKANSMMLVLWTVIVTILMRVGYTFPEQKKVEAKKSPATPPKKQKKANKKANKKAKQPTPELPW